MNRLRCLGHFIGLTGCALGREVGSDWKMVWGDQSVKRQYEDLTQRIVPFKCSETSRLGFTRSPERWLRTISDIAQ